MEVACSLLRPPPPDRVAVANIQRRPDMEHDFLDLLATYQDVHFKLLRMVAGRNQFFVISVCLRSVLRYVAGP